jgi:hypothetical protein
MKEIDLRDKVVAVFDLAAAADAAVADLKSQGHDVELLRGEEGRRRLDPIEAEGEFFGSLRKAFLGMGGENRLRNQVEDELSADRSFVVVDAVDDEQAAAVAGALREHGGHFLWHLGKWTYVRLGEADRAPAHDG